MVNAFFDESGKFKDHSTIAFSGIAAGPQDFIGFTSDWKNHLRLNGLKSLTMKRALNVNSPLSEKRAARGIANRIDVLKPFAECIRKHMQNVVGVAVDVEAFHRAPSHLQRLWGHDPFFLAFTRILLAVIEPASNDDKINIICDDEEAVALGMYKLYRRVKIVHADARSRLASIAFADDEAFCALQAADFIASLTRLEARRHFHGEDYEYRSLWRALQNPTPDDRLWGFSGCFVNQDMMDRMAADLLASKKKHPTRGSHLSEPK